MNQINKLMLNANYFILFDLPVTYELNSKKLRAAYTNLQSQYHPDRFVACSEAERNDALRASSYLNQANETLKSCAKRASYLLELEGIMVSNHANLCNDTSFLMGQMMLREKLESVLTHDAPDGLIEEVQESALQLQIQVSGDFCKAYDQLKTLSSINQNKSLLSQAQDSVLKLRFIEKLFDEVDVIQVKLLD